MRATSKSLIFAAAALASAAVAQAELQPPWITTLSGGSVFMPGLSYQLVDANGVSYVTGTAGTSSNNDIHVAVFEPSGAVRWSRTWDGPAGWHDQSHGLALGPGGVLWVAGNTPGPGMYANVLLLEYDVATGALLRTIQYSSGPLTSEAVGTIVTDAQGNVYAGGGTVGDGSDGMLLKFDANGQLLWKRVWDGPAPVPYSQDNVRMLKMSPAGEIFALVHGVMDSLHPDYVVLKIDPATGGSIWEGIWGVNGEDHPRDMEIDAAGDVYVTGTGIDWLQKYSTIKLRGSDGALLWQFYDWVGNENTARALAVDSQGGVYVTGSFDPEGDLSNFNDNYCTVKRDATTGMRLWTHVYGAPCHGCYDIATDVVVDPYGHAYVTGRSSTAPYSADALTFVLDSVTGREITRGAVDGGPGRYASPEFLRFDAAYNLYNAGEMPNPSTGFVDMYVFRYDALSRADAAFCLGDGSLAACPCGNSGAGGRGCANSQNPAGGALVASGTPPDTLTLHAGGMPTSTTALFLQGSGLLSQPLLFGDGFRCVGGQLLRLGTKTASAGNAQFPGPGDPSIRARVQALGSSNRPGSVRHYQTYYRDPSPSFCPSPAGDTWNMTNGVTVPW